VSTTFALLTLAVLALWARGWWWAGLFVASLGSALIAGVVRPIGLVWIAAFATASWSGCERERVVDRPLAHARSHRHTRIGATIAILVIAAGLMTHTLPGFANPRVLDQMRFSADALPFRLHTNYDKALVGLFLLALCHPRLARAADWRAMLRAAAPVAGGTIVTLLGLALAAGYVRFDPKFPPETWLFLWVNLCFTCVAEEALFRGFIQRQLTLAWAKIRHGAWFALLAAAVLFGLAHAGGGPVYVALSTVAGLGYGWAYLRTGQRIEAGILTHFALNAVHFVGFTYPALE